MTPSPKQSVGGATITRQINNTKLYKAIDPESHPDMCMGTVEKIIVCFVSDALDHRRIRCCAANTARHWWWYSGYSGYTSTT